MLKLTEQQIEVTHLSPYTEMHGDEPVTMMAAKLEANLPPEVLDDLVPGLRAAFFKPANSAGEMKGPLALAFPDLKQPLEILGDWPGYRIEFLLGSISNTNIAFGDVELGKLRVEMVEGGAVTLTFRLKFGGKPEELGSKLLPLLNKKWPVTLTPPEPKPLPSVHPDAKGNGKAASAPARAGVADAPLAGTATVAADAGVVRFTH